MTVSSADLLEAWRDAVRAAELADRLATSAIQAAEQADDRAAVAADISALADRAAAAALRAADRANAAAQEAATLAKSLRDEAVPQSAATATSMREVEEATREAAHQAVPRGGEPDADR